MGAGSIRVGRLAGILIGIHPLWLLLVALITWSLGAVYYPDEVDGIAPGFSYALGFVSAMLLFASILLHELGHAVIARRHGVEIEEIDMWLLGGVAKLSGSPRHATDELRYAIAARRDGRRDLSGAATSRPRIHRHPRGRWRAPSG